MKRRNKLLLTAGIASAAAGAAFAGQKVGRTLLRKRREHKAEDSNPRLDGRDNVQATPYPAKPAKQQGDAVTAH